jgi:hypothetical protein
VARRTSRVQVGRSRYSYGARAIPVAAVAKTSATTSSRSDPAYIAAQVRNIVEARDHQALTDLQNGKLVPFITYAEERITYAQDDADRQRWTKLLNDAQDKAEEDAVAAGVEAGDVTLEEAKQFLTDRRDQHTPDDPRFAELTQRIADTNNAIQARDFNAELNTAVSQMVEAGNTMAAKQKYLDTLIKILPRAKDPKAQSTIQKQMVDLHDAIIQDRITARSTETSAKLVGYYNGTVSGSDVQAFLQEKANTALSADEARAYATAASQVATRERTAATARLRSASAGSVSAAVATALKPLTKSTTDATAAFAATTKRTGVPDTIAFKTMREAAQIELDAIETALPQAGAAAADALIKRREALLTSVNTAQRAAATKTVQAEKDRTTAFNETIDTLRKQGAPYEETAKLAAQRVASVKFAQAQPWMQGYEEDPTLGGDLAAIEQKTRKILTDETATQTGTLTGETPTTKKIAAEYDRYAKYFVGKGVQAPLGMDEWFRLMTNETDAAAASKASGLPTDAASIKDMRIEQDNVRTIWQDRHNEIQAAADRLTAAAWPRDAQGGRIDYNAPLPGETRVGPGRSPYFDPTRGGQFDPAVFGPLVAAHQRGGSQDFTLPDAGAGVTGAGAAPAPADQQGANTGAPDLNEMKFAEAAARRQARAAMDPHDAADSFLQEPTIFTYPTWEIPALPDWGAFTPNTTNPDRWDQFMPPALPTFSGPTIPSFTAPPDPYANPFSGSDPGGPPPAPAAPAPVVTGGGGRRV